MTSIFPQIEDLQAIPQHHKNYAKGLLSICIKSLLELEDIVIGVYGNSGSFIAFDSNEFEHANLELRYEEYKFTIIATDNYEDLETSVFKYNIHENDSELFNMIPEGLISAMENAAIDGESITLSSTALNN